MFGKIKLRKHTRKMMRPCLVVSNQLKVFKNCLVRNKAAYTEREYSKITKILEKLEKSL